MKSPGERDIYLISARRTPFGRFGGALRDLSATDLAVVAARAALEAAQIDPGAVDAVIFGNVAQTSADAIYLARHVASAAARVAWGSRRPVSAAVRGSRSPSNPRRRAPVVKVGHAPSS